MKLMKSLTLATLMTVSLGAMTTPASAHVYGTYGHCVSVTWDPFGCGLIAAFGIANISTPDDLTPDEETRDRIKTMMSKGAFKSLDVEGKSEGEGTLVRTCDTVKTLDMFEKGADLKEIMSACYKQEK